MSARVTVSHIESVDDAISVGLLVDFDAVIQDRHSHA
jgi:hypothetical protein